MTDSGDIPYGENTIIRYRIWVKDRAGNVNTTSDTDGWYFIATHRTANFVTRRVYISLGQSYNMRVQVRNLENEFDTITLVLGGDYHLAEFLDVTDEGVTVSGDGKSLDVGLNPGEERTFYVRIMSSEVTEEPQSLTLTATSELLGGESDSDQALITVGYPASFPGLSPWAAMILVLASLGIFWKLGPMDRNR
jgi:hypothetical protein